MKMYRHGDLLIKEIEKIPKKLIELKTKTLAFGEVTGHAHVLSAGKTFAKNMKSEPEFLLLEQDAELTHEEHKPILISKGVYQVIREREYNPFLEQIRKVMDWDGG